MSKGFGVNNRAREFERKVRSIRRQLNIIREIHVFRSTEEISVFATIRFKALKVAAHQFAREHQDCCIYVFTPDEDGVATAMVNPLIDSWGKGYSYTWLEQSENTGK